MPREAVAAVAVVVDIVAVAGVEHLCTLAAVQPVVGEDARVDTAHVDCGTA